MVLVDLRGFTRLDPPNHFGRRFGNHHVIRIKLGLARRDSERGINSSR